MKIDIEKDKLQKGLSYAFKTSDIEKVLTENQIESNVYLTYSKSKIFFDAWYSPPTENMGYVRLYVRGGSIQSDQRKEAVIYMNDIVFPDFVGWLKRGIKLPKNSTKLFNDNYFRRDFI